MLITTPDGFLEVPQTIADGFAELRQFPWPEEKQHDNQDDDQVPRL